MTISCIALDRYQAVRVGAKKRWEPNLWVCLACMLLIWSACAGKSGSSKQLAISFNITYSYKHLAHLSPPKIITAHLANLDILGDSSVTLPSRGGYKDSNVEKGSHYLSDK
jgi:hypothetical protein